MSIGKLLDLPRDSEEFLTVEIVLAFVLLLDYSVLKIALGQDIAFLLNLILSSAEYRQLGFPVLLLMLEGFLKSFPERRVILLAELNGRELSGELLLQCLFANRTLVTPTA